jgi:hypothetical protein
MKKQDHLEVFRRAVDLASSGDCQSWNEVQQRLVEKGYLRAPELLDGPEIRRVLDAQCALGRKVKKTTLS